MSTGDVDLEVVGGGEGDVALHALVRMTDAVDLFDVIVQMSFLSESGIRADLATVGLLLEVHHRHVLVQGGLGAALVRALVAFVRLFL